MANVINGTDSGQGGLITTGDSSDELQLQTAETTAVTITSGQQSAFIAGTASAPAVTTTGDLNTGVFFPAADNIGFATGGTIRGRWTTDGLCFGSDTAAANALDDYEEGTFTPQFADAATGGNVASATVAGRYVKVGKLVSLQIALDPISTTGLTGANVAFIRNLPFTTATPIVFGFGVQVTNVTFSGYVSGFVNAADAGRNAFRLFESSSGTSHAPLTVSDFTSGSASIFTSFTYETA